MTVSEPQITVKLVIARDGEVLKEVPLRAALEWMAVALDEKGTAKLAADEMERNIRRMIRTAI